MNTIRLRYLTLVVTLAAVIFLSGCGGNTKERERQRREAEDMVYAAYLDKDYPRIIELVDSFKPQGCFSEGKACYWLGYAYDRMMQKRMAELYWKTGIAAVENSTIRSRPESGHTRYRKAKKPGARHDQRIHQHAHLHRLLSEPSGIE